MSAGPYAPPAEVVGDGTTARGRWTTRLRRARWPLVIAGCLLAAAALAAVLQPRTSTAVHGPDNPDDKGARAVAEVLAEQGVRVVPVRTSGAALAEAAAGDTLLVTSTYLLSYEQVSALADSPADLVVLEPEPGHLETLTGGALLDAWTAGGEERAAQCSDPDAQAAGRIAPEDGAGLTPAPGSEDEVTVCFPEPDGGGHLYAVVRSAGRTVTVLGDADLITNARVTDAGNAALVLRSLGRNPELVWYVPSYDDLGEPLGPGAAGPGLDDLLPPAVRPLALQLALVLVVAALWRGRALGRLVTEPLPVTVRSSESTLGRGLLYRRARAQGHAAAGLRAATARRAAARLGLPRTADAPAVVDALARATGRSTHDVTDLLYGPPPTDDAGLLQLARQLDELESEVHRT